MVWWAHSSHIILSKPEAVCIVVIKPYHLNKIFKKRRINKPNTMGSVKRNDDDTYSFRLREYYM